MKSAVRELAACGGAPAFGELLHVGRPNIGDRARLLARIEGILDRRWLTNNGPCVQEFEAAIARYTGAAHCVSVCNATIALELVARALDLTGRVIVPSFTFVATAHALDWVGLMPVFCDIDPVTHNLDPVRVEELITPDVSAILGVHVWGRPCAPGPLAEIAARHNLNLIFDAAHAFGVSHNGRMIGNHGDCEVFSFHGTKFVNSFEGGAVVTNDAALASRIRLMANFGFAGYDNVVTGGTNGKMNEACAAMGLTSLESIEDIIETNRRNYLAYRSEFDGVPGVRLTPYDQVERCNYQYVVIEIDGDACGLTRDDLQRLLQAEHIAARRYFYPGCHSMAAYRDRGSWDCPHTEALSDRVLSLPTGTAVGASEIATIAQIIRFAIAHASEVQSHLRRLPTVSTR